MSPTRLAAAGCRAPRPARAPRPVSAPRPIPAPGGHRSVAPRLDDYDYVLINSSGGKDSQAMLWLLAQTAASQGFPRSRMIVVHADLGRMEWPGTRDLAQRQAELCGLPFEVVQRPGGDLLTHVEERGKWPSASARYCTSDHKTSQVRRFMTRLAAQHRTIHGPAQVRILNCLGLRAQESPARAGREPFAPETAASNGRRQVDRWLPIHAWTTEQVWHTIRASGLPWHPAYDAGLARLSCVLCVLAPRRQLELAARLNPELTRQYAAVEQRIGHRFKTDLSITEVAVAAGAFTHLSVTSTA